MKITPVPLIDEIEKSLPFWVEHMGFTKTVEVPEGERLGFVIPEHEGGEVMLQSLAPARKDDPKLAPERIPSNGWGGLFVELSGFADACRRLRGYPVAMAERVTFYGMREIGVREPRGHLVVFAARA